MTTLSDPLQAFGIASPLGAIAETTNLLLMRTTHDRFLVKKVPKGSLVRSSIGVVRIRIVVSIASGCLKQVDPFLIVNIVKETQ